MENVENDLCFFCNAKTAAETLEKLFGTREIYFQVKSKDISTDNVPDIIISSKELREEEIIRKEKESSRNDIENLVVDFLNKIGTPYGKGGYICLEYILIFFLESEESQYIEMMNSVTKILYPSIAKGINKIIATNSNKIVSSTTIKEKSDLRKYTAATVERNIRYAISQMWKKKKDINLLKEIFCCESINFESRPTNTEFISLATKHLKNKKFNIINKINYL